MVLQLDVLVDDLDESFGAADTEDLEDAYENHLEALQIPVLVDDRVDHV